MFCILTAYDGNSLTIAHLDLISFVDGGNTNNLFVG